jgi:hypothetical protein
MVDGLGVFCGCLKRGDGNDDDDGGGGGDECEMSVK